MKDYTLTNLTLLIFRDMVTKSNEPFCPQGFLNLGKPGAATVCGGRRTTFVIGCMDQMFASSQIHWSEPYHPIVTVLGGGALGR